MPNWVTNNIEIEGSESEIVRLVEFVKSDESDFDFNKIIPMPKSLDIESGSSNYQDIYWYLSERGTKSMGEVKANPLSKLINSLWGMDEAKKQAEENGASYETGKQLCDNYTKYGATTWYDWRWTNWGAKWNAREPYVEASGKWATIEFETAWSMPENIFRELCKKFPHLTMNGVFADEDIGNNCGTWENDNGELIVDYVDTVEFACEVWGIDDVDNYI